MTPLDDTALDDMEMRSMADPLPVTTPDAPADLELEIVYSGPPGAYQRADRVILNDVPMSMPWKEAADHVKGYPEHFSFVDPNALELIADMVRLDREREIAALPPAPEMIDSAALARERAEIEAKRAAVARALEGKT